MGPGRHRAVRAKKEAVKIVFRAPPPGSKSGVADYAAVLEPALRKLAGAGPDVHLYHLGNNRLHESIYREALTRPGVIVLHDAVLHHFMLGTLSEREYVDEWVFNYGEWHRQLGEQLWRERARSGTDLRYFRYPLLKRVIAASQGVIVHNPGAAAIAREHGAERVAVIPHFYQPPMEPIHAVEAAEFRRQLGIEQGATVFGIFGYLRETKRVIPSLASFFRVHRAHPETALLLAGEAVSPDLARLLRSEANHPAVRRTGHLTDRQLEVAMAATDCCINLRYPAAGESSGIAIRMMGAGKPVILSDLPENAEFPDAAALRVKPGLSEAAELFAEMELMAQHPRIRRQMGEVAERHIREFHDLGVVARQYAEAVKRFTSE